MLLHRLTSVDIPTAALAVISLILLPCFRLNSAWLALGGGLVGIGIISWVQG